jgi:polysaccharide export outer membrane protein
MRAVALSLVLGLTAQFPCWAMQNAVAQNAAQNAPAAAPADDDGPIPAAPTDANAPAPAAAGHVSSPEDVIGPDDSITVSCLESMEISRTWRITSVGDVDLPLVGKVHAAGLTAEQLQESLATSLKTYIRDPHVTVYIAEFRSQPVTVTGAVHRPGTFQTEGPKTLWTVLTMAGGLEKDPGATVTVTRQIKYGNIPLPDAHPSADGKKSVIDLPMRDVIDATSAASNLLIEPNDVVAVSTDARLVFIIGEVIKPGAVELVNHDSISMMQLLAAANGLSKLANPAHSEIMRKNGEGLYEKVGSVDLKRLVNGRIKDRMLNAGDIVVVPSSTLKTYTQMAGYSAISSGFFLLTRY